MHRFAVRGLMAALVLAGALAVAPVAGAATAPAQVFAPNPVADLGIESLTTRRTPTSSAPTRSCTARTTGSRSPT